MGKKRDAPTQFFVATILVITVTAAIIFCTVALGSSTVNHPAEFWFVCSAVRDNSLSADALSGSTENAGGAGYILEYGGNFYVTVAMYYGENDAEKIKNSLKKRGMDCTVLKVTTGEYPIKSHLSKSDINLYEGNLNTLYSLSRMCYECANGVDSGQINQNGAQSVLVDVQNSIKRLQTLNKNNCFAAELKRLAAECESVKDGYVLSKNLRKLQIAIADTLINIELY